MERAPFHFDSRKHLVQSSQSVEQDAFPCSKSDDVFQFVNNTTSTMFMFLFDSFGNVLLVKSIRIYVKAASMMSPPDTMQLDEMIIFDPLIRSMKLHAAISAYVTPPTTAISQDQDKNERNGEIDVGNGNDVALDCLSGQHLSGQSLQALRRCNQFAERASEGTGHGRTEYSGHANQRDASVRCDKIAKGGVAEEGTVQAFDSVREHRERAGQQFRAIANDGRIDAVQSQ